MATFSIITACFNSSKSIEDTIRSVDGQDFSQDEIQHLFIDGGSQDGTLSIIKKHMTANKVLVSEPDRGIYDAMNKGIALAQGEWLCFLNSDDTFYSKNVLSQIADQIKHFPDAEFIYGKVALVQDGKVISYIGTPLQKENYWYPSKYICHQAVFFHRSLFDKLGGFEVGVPGGISDYIWFAKYFALNPQNFHYVDVLVSNFCDNGHSLTNVWPAYVSLLRFSKDFFPWKIRLKFYAMFPEKFLKFKVLQLHKDTSFRRLYRRIMNSIKGR